MSAHWDPRDRTLAAVTSHQVLSNSSAGRCHTQSPAVRPCRIGWSRLGAGWAIIGSRSRSDGTAGNSVLNVLRRSNSGKATRGHTQPQAARGRLQGGESASAQHLGLGIVRAAFGA